RGEAVGHLGRALGGLVRTLDRLLRTLDGLVRGRRRATRAAELLPERELRATGTARGCERRTAVLAELRPGTVLRLALRTLHSELPAGNTSDDRRASPRLAPILRGSKNLGEARSGNRRSSRVSSSPTASNPRADPCSVRAGNSRSGTVEGLVASDGHAMSVPPLREVVPHGLVLDAAIVPERDGALLPPEAAVVLGHRCA